MKKTLICFVVLLSYAIAVMECGAFGIGNQNVFRVPGKTCVPLSAADLAVSPPDSAPLLPKDIMGKVTISLFRRKGKIKAYPPTLNDNGRIARRLQDERGWEMPLEGMDPLGDPLTPPARLGIKDWSEWYPCPGTRLRMMWDLFPSTAPSGKSERSESCRKGYGL